jgi:hypothetical protein
MAVCWVVAPCTASIIRAMSEAVHGRNGRDKREKSGKADLSQTNKRRQGCTSRLVGKCSVGVRGRGQRTEN